MKEPCPYCHGAGKAIRVIENPTTGIKRTAIRWCICSKSKFVSENTDHKILAGLGEDYLPFEEVDKQLIFKPNDLAGSPNLIIEAGTDDASFRYHLKGIIMKYGFADPAPLFLCCESIEILKRFYVAQGDGSSPQLTDVNKFDLLVMILGTNEKNDQLKTCVAQVIYNRISLRKPTWVFLRVPYGNCIQEKSDDLEIYLQRFERITLSNTNKAAPVKISKSKEAAENFSPIGMSHGDRT
jgi:hypothetical protein